MEIYWIGAVLGFESHNITELKINNKINYSLMHRYANDFILFKLSFTEFRKFNKITKV